MVRPDFIGTASQPDATISLYATTAGSTTPLLIGTGTSDANGAWSITADQALADGSYAITAVGADPSGQAVSGATTVVPDLVIDTVGPKVTGFSVDRKTGRIVVTFQDFGGLNNMGVGLDMASVVDAGNYQLVAAHDRRVQAYRMTVASVKPGTTAGTQTVTLRVTGRTYFHGGRYSLRIDSASPADPSGIQDNAGNPLDGEFTGTLPSGNGVPGGDFVARLSAIASTPARCGPDRRVIEPNEKRTQRLSTHSLVTTQGWVDVLFPNHPREETAPRWRQLEQGSDPHERIVPSTRMGSRATPRITARGVDQPRPNRIKLHVPRRGQEIRLIEYERREPPLPQMASPPLAKVDHACVTPMDLADRPSQPVG